MELIVYDKNTNKIVNLYSALSVDDVVLKENEAIFENTNITDFSQTDIRAYNKDGSVKSLEQQVKEKIIALEKNQIIKNNQVYTLNKNIEEDFIILIEKGLETLDNRQKIVTNDNGRKYITQKTYEELFKENVITAEEYNNYILQIRQGEYQSNLDGARAELLESVLSSLAIQNLLTDEQKNKLENLKTQRQDIKDQYPKKS
ncbi:phage tail protein [Brachyspira sp.]|uniref:phage tail protein n=1 Tax=Brachyspira sp. TaxID=1977261 RepID=UPI00262D8240|nr:phage tail protein [Brachyspira sp.]